ncbi:hypothetical protein M0R45_019760 [Rubus argutus]|uniref:Uncharacterized protein n=1 Tax=Rubus argutus TaxID=59490 RepID=A0AAW1X6S4_RUBAR
MFFFSYASRSGPSCCSGGGGPCGVGVDEELGEWQGRRRHDEMRRLIWLLTAPRVCGVWVIGMVCTVYWAWLFLLQL